MYNFTICCLYRTQFILETVYTEIARVVLLKLYLPHFICMKHTHNLRDILTCFFKQLTSKTHYNLHKCFFEKYFKIVELNLKNNKY